MGESFVAPNAAPQLPTTACVLNQWNNQTIECYSKDGRQISEGQIKWWSSSEKSGHAAGTNLRGLPKMAVKCSL